MYVLRGSRITSLSGLLAVALASAQTGQVLHNGITLPAVWPPVRPLAITSQVPPYLISPPPVIPINIGRQLLVDDFLVESTTLTRNNHQATLHPVPILLPGPYENGIWSAPFSDGVWYDPADGLYKLFYKGGVTGLAIGIAYSTDGLTWVRPSIPDSPTPNSNLVIKTNGRDSGTVWLDMLDANPARRFKAFLYQGGGNQRSYFSPDGIHFTLQTAPIYSIYDRTTFFWNAFRQLWVKSARSTEIVTGNAQRPTGDQRVRYYSESPDLVTWTPAARSEAFWVASDDLDPVYPNTTTYPELYNLDAVSYESLTVGMFSMFYPAPGPDLVELNVGFSRDGFYWSRPARGGGPANAFIPASGVAGSWNGFNTQSAGGAFLVVGDELWFYFSARNAPHSVTPTQISTGVAKLRRDGFVSLDAGPVEGTLTTRPITFTGNQLYVNVDAPAGSLQVEILDTAGNVIAPFSKANSLVVQANQTKRQVTWSGVSSLAAIIGQPVKFRFYLQNGKLYSFWVTSSPQGASNGPIAAGGPGFTGPVDKDPQTDFTAPFRLSGAPSGTLTNPVPPNVTLSLITDEPAACRYSPTPGQNYAAMPAAFSAQPGLTSHSAQITVTQSSTPATLSYYVRCQDTVGNANTNDYTIAFVVPSTAPTQGVAALTISPSQVYGGLPVSGSAVTLIAAAPAGGATVSLSSSNPVVASVPAVVDLLAGATISPSFLIATAAVSVTTPVQITATYAGVSITSTLTVVPYPELNTFTVSQASVTGGVSIQGNLSLTGAAAGLSDVNLVSGSPAVLAVPPVVQIADGATSALPFTITTTPVTSTVNVIITATRRSVTKTVSVTVAPVPALAALVAAPADLYLNAAPSTGTVTLNTPAPPGGLSVTLTSDTPHAASVPATITVPVNATTATFPIVAGAAVADTAVTITATYLTVTLTSPITVRVPRAVQALTLGSLSILGGTTVSGSQVSINQSALAAGT